MLQSGTVFNEIEVVLKLKCYCIVPLVISSHINRFFALKPLLYFSYQAVIPRKILNMLGVFAELQFHMCITMSRQVKGALRCLSD